MRDYHPNHLCRVCGQKFENHAGRGNPHVAENTCPSGKFPKWPTTIDDEQAAGVEFDRRVAAFWKASGSTFQPKQ